MIYSINKYHRTVEGGEATSSVREIDMDAAVQDYHQLATNYMADPNVVEWSLAIVDPIEMKVKKRDHYIKNSVPPEVHIDN